MSDDDRKAVMTAAFNRLAARMLAASDNLSTRTLEAVRRSLEKLRRRIDGDPRWLNAVLHDVTIRPRD